MIIISAYAVPGVKFDLQPVIPGHFTFHEITLNVCNYFNAEMSDIMTPGKGKRECVYIRDWCIWFCVRYTNCTLEKIAAYFCGRHHTSIIFARDKVTYQLSRVKAQFHDKYRRDYGKLSIIIDALKIK